MRPLWFFPEDPAEIGSARAFRTNAYSFIYSFSTALATHGREMYLGPWSFGGSNCGQGVVTANRTLTAKLIAIPISIPAFFPTARGPGRPSNSVRLHGQSSTFPIRYAGSRRSWPR